MTVSVPRLCECGCGQPTPISSETRVERGWIKGQPSRFVLGHNSRCRAPEVRFLESIDRIEDGCWLWHRTLDTGGYGRFWVRDRMMPAHRWAYEHFTGPIPDGLELDHLCRVRRCVNPAHLEPVTRTENQRRGFGASGQNARKTHCPKGHAYDAVASNGRRQCRRCRREWFREFRARRKRKALAPFSFEEQA